MMVKDTPLFNILSRVFTSSRAAGDPQSSKSSKEQTRKDALVAQFCQITGAKSVSLPYGCSPRTSRAP